MTPDKRNGSAERDSQRDRAYRVGAQEAPPAHLDAAILAAAHRAVGAAPRPLSARLRAWRVPVSIAAVVVVSVSLVTLIREEGGDKLDSSSAAYLKDSQPAPVPKAATEAPQAQERAQPPMPATAEAPAAAKPQRDDSAASKAGSRSAEEAKIRDSAASAQRAEDTLRRPDQSGAGPSDRPQAQPPAPAAAPSPRPFPEAGPVREQQPAPHADFARAPARSSADARGASGQMGSSMAPGDSASGAGSETRQAQSEKSAGGGALGSLSMDRPAAPAAPTAKPGPRLESRALKVEQAKQADTARLAPLLKELDAQPAEKWLEKIEALRRDGRKDDADDLLAEFKRRFPDYPLPAASRNP